MITLPSGRTICPNINVIGIDDKLKTFEGYDGPLEPVDYLVECGEETAWSVEDRQALADLMIDRWTRYRSLEL